MVKQGFFRKNSISGIKEWLATVDIELLFMNAMIVALLLLALIAVDLLF